MNTVVGLFNDYSNAELAVMIATGTTASKGVTTLGMTAFGADCCAATGSLLRTLMDSGFSHQDAEFYAEGVKQGGVLVSVQTDSKHTGEIRDILQGTGAMTMPARSQTRHKDAGSVAGKTNNSGKKLIDVYLAP